ncbi:DSPc-domain-containing protein [Metschnikowia bicuspidata]|uniref:protein-tyrosine-phosphatase n=1 Tax=Metschnikowia bicuspidata TaxID=27322 RepID=A0A4P9ZET3_9ASCO|nr:DSPc-domain-containing protein [Metschnikowia bicuspidata]
MINQIDSRSDDDSNASLSSTPNCGKALSRSIEKVDGVNYSPCQTKKLASVSQSRNINFKNLLLEISPQKLTKSSSSPRRTAPLTLAVPDEDGSHYQTPLTHRANAMSAPDFCLTSMQLADPSSQEEDLTATLENLLHIHRKTPGHEELQESTSMNAYPNGPANVLDLILYLYSDPYLSEKPIYINDYDLVLNVAKECKDLTSEFHSTEGKRYLHIPWSHTSSILDMLPEITNQLSEIDKPGKKALIHCQCGVLRSACVVVAYFMVKFGLSVNEAYELLKSGTTNKNEPINDLIGRNGHFVQACEKICPNMNLIFELMDFGEHIKANGKHNNS